MVSTVVQDSPYKLFVGGLPSYLNEEQVRILYNFVFCLFPCILAGLDFFSVGLGLFQIVRASLENTQTKQFASFFRHLF